MKKKFNFRRKFVYKQKTIIEKWL